MYYDPEKGVIGNLEDCLKRNQQNSNRICKEQVERSCADTENLEALEEALAGADEAAIALYEAQEAQEAISAQQDEALMELYEMKY